VSGDVKYRSKRGAVAADIADPFVCRRVETHLGLLGPLDATIRRLEAEVDEAAQEHSPTELAVLQTTPGVGAVLSLTILLEIDAVGRFESRQQFCSYARLCGAVQEPDGKRAGVGNRKAGNAWLKWASPRPPCSAPGRTEQHGPQDCPTRGRPPPSQCQR
jgi:transposase